MKDVYVIADNTITSLGFSTKEFVDSIEAGKNGFIDSDRVMELVEKVPLSVVNNQLLSEMLKKYGISDAYTRFESLLLLSITKATENLGIDLSSEDTLLILSSTKGNIDLLEEEKKNMYGFERAYLHASAKEIQKYFSLKHTPVFISNACISGILAILNAQRMLSDGKYKHIIVAGADILSKFVVTGFQSFKSLSPTPCKPFDKNRVGLSIGEGVGTIVLSNEIKSDIRVVKGATANDANHISGPSRTGEGLFISISKTLNGDTGIDYISAHGTATPYNDDMESIALKRANLNSVPVNSFKGYFGHTLGAAGVIEAIAGIESMKRNKVFKTLGTETVGVVEEINVVTQTVEKEIKRFLKIGSGFGGCNAAILFEKDDK